MPSALETRLSQLGLTVNDQLMDRALRHSVFLKRLQTYEANRVANYIDQYVMPDLLGQLARRLEGIKTRGFDLGPATTKRLKTLTAEMGTTITEGFRKVRDEFGQGMYDLAKSEAARETNALTRAVSPLKNIAPTLIETVVPSAGLMREVVYRRPFQGRLLKDWFAGIGEGMHRSVQDQLRIGLIEGESTGAIMARIRGTGAIPGVGRAAKRQALTVARTAITHVTTQAREATYQENAHLMNGVQWVSVLDAKTTDYCFDGSSLVVSLGAPLRVFRRSYQGDMAIIRTASGKELRATPNHPVLTARGWLPAHELKPVHDVLYAFSGEGLCVPCRKYVGAPPTFSEVADAALDPSRSNVFAKSTSAADFHGDGAGTNGDISVATLHGDLMRDIESRIFESAGDEVLGRLYAGSVGLDGLGATLNHLGLQPGSWKMAPELNSSFVQDAVHDCLTSANRTANGIGLHTAIEHLDDTASLDIGNAKLLTSGVMFHEPVPLEVGGHGRCSCSVVPCQRCGALAVTVSTDQIRSVRVKTNYSGHVFNLQTETGSYLISGCLVHNCYTLDGQVFPIGEGPRPPGHLSCRSTTAPSVKSLYELGLTKAEYKATDPGMRAAFGSTGPASVPINITGEQFLRRQSKEFQAEVLGKGRAELFRRGKVSFSKFVDHRGRPMSLRELEKIESRLGD